MAKKKMGMQMPSGRARRAGGPDIYTVLVGCAALALAAACFVMFKEGGKIGKAGNAFSLQDATGKIDLAPDAK